MTLALSYCICRIDEGEMKHCQITGVKMPDEMKARDEASRKTGWFELGDQAPFDAGWNARADWQAKRDDMNKVENPSLLVNDSSAEFPEAWGLTMDYCRRKEVTPASLTFEDYLAGLKKGFERGYQIGGGTLFSVRVALPLREKQLAEAQAKNEELESDLIETRIEIARYKIADYALLRALDIVDKQTILNICGVGGMLWRALERFKKSRTVDDEQSNN